MCALHAGFSAGLGKNQGKTCKQRRADMSLRNLASERAAVMMVHWHWRCLTSPSGAPREGVQNMAQPSEVRPRRAKHQWKWRTEGHWLLALAVPNVTFCTKRRSPKHGPAFRGQASEGPKPSGSEGRRGTGYRHWWCLTSRSPKPWTKNLAKTWRSIPRSGFGAARLSEGSSNFPLTRSPLPSAGVGVCICRDTVTYIQIYVCV